MKKTVAILALSIVVNLASGCGGGSNGNANNESGSVQGLVQKGPFVIGSEVWVQELTRDLVPTGIVYLTETIDDAGSFELTADINSEYLDIRTTGFYYNEVTGSLSNASITLNAIAGAEENNINVNILTTLSYRRIKYLIQKNSMSLLEAQEQAENEVLKIFHIDKDLLGAQFSKFNRMDITQDGSSNAVLLAISCILQLGNTEAGLSEIIAKISSDIETDGALNDQIYIDKIANSSMALAPQANFIRQNINTRYASLGRQISVPYFEDFIDSDGDGIIAIYETKNPEFGLVEGVYNHDIAVSLSSATDNAIIFYTTDGSDPSPSSLIYSSPILISGNGTIVTIRAMAIKESLNDSNVVGARYTIEYSKVIAPMLNLYAGTYNRDISVSLSTFDTEAIVYYTTDGSNPSYSSPIYNNPIPIAGDGTVMTIRAFAAQSNKVDSYIITSYYKIDYGFDPSQSMQNLSINEYNINIVGTWIGGVETPWTKPYNVEVTFYSTGIYSAHSLSQQKFGDQDDFWGPAFYYGTDEDSNLKTYYLFDLYANGAALGNIAILFSSGGTTTDSLRFIKFFNSFNNMNFEVWHFDVYGPLKFNLTRKQ
jgi:hypothetical protein